MKICVKFQAFKNLYPPKKQKNIRKLEKKSFASGKKKFGSDTDTEIGPWFLFPKLKPGCGRTLVIYMWMFPWAKVT